MFAPRLISDPTLPPLLSSPALRLRNKDAFHTSIVTHPQCTPWPLRHQHCSNACILISQFVLFQILSTMDSLMSDRGQRGASHDHQL